MTLQLSKNSFTPSSCQTGAFTLHSQPELSPCSHLNWSFHSPLTARAFTLLSAALELSLSTHSQSSHLALSQLELSLYTHSQSFHLALIPAVAFTLHSQPELSPCSHLNWSFHSPLTARSLTLLSSQLELSLSTHIQSSHLALSQLEFSLSAHSHSFHLALSCT